MCVEYQIINSWAAFSTFIFRTVYSLSIWIEADFGSYRVFFLTGPPQKCFDWPPPKLSKCWNHIHFARHLGVFRSEGGPVWDSVVFLKSVTYRPTLSKFRVGPVKKNTLYLSPENTLLTESSPWRGFCQQMGGSVIFCFLLSTLHLSRPLTNVANAFSNSLRYPNCRLCSPPPLLKVTQSCYSKKMEQKTISSRYRW